MRIDVYNRGRYFGYVTVPYAVEAESTEEARLLSLEPRTLTIKDEEKFFKQFNSDDKLVELHWYDNVQCPDNVRQFIAEFVSYRNDEPAQDVIVCPQTFGDIVMLRSLVFSYWMKHGKRPIVVVKRKYAEPLLGSKSIKRLGWFQAEDPKFNEFGQFREQGFNVKHILLKFLSGKKYLYSLYERKIHYFLDAGLQLGITPDEWTFAPLMQKKIELPSKPYVVLHPLSRVGLKNWKRFSELAKKLKKHINVVQVYSKADVKSGRKPIAGVKAYESLSFRELAYLVKNAELVVGVDSVVGHIAANVDTKSVILFGPTIPEVCRPLRNNIAVKPQFPIGPCEHGCHDVKCRLGGKCIDWIQVDDVLSVVEKALDSEHIDGFVEVAK